MVKIVVTGAAGKAGRWTVRELMEAGHEVIASDKKLTEESPAPHFVQADLRDYGQACQLIMGSDAVVHLAAIPTDVRNTPQAVFANNMIINFNVFEACKDWDVPKIVWASSQTTMGYPFTPEFLHYVPQDEEHPVAPRSSYSMVKLLTEHLGGIYNHLAGKQIVALRFSNIYEPDEYAKVPMHWNDTERDKHKMNLWAYTDARDAASACLLALQRDDLGASFFNITAADTIMPDLSEDLAHVYFPGVPFKRPVPGHETLVAIDKARQVLGYEPRYTWRNVLDDNGNLKPETRDWYSTINV